MFDGLLKIFHDEEKGNSGQLSVLNDEFKERTEGNTQ